MAFYVPVFFDVTVQDDLDLLHSAVRNDSELDNVIANVEYEILDYYKQRPSIPLGLQVGRENLYNTNQVSVRLLGYDQDNPANSTQQLKDALKKTIAEVASWVIRNYNTPQNMQSIRQGKRSLSYHGRSPSWRDFPDGWQRWLSNFDDREARYSI